MRQAVLTEVTLWNRPPFQLGKLQLADQDQWFSSPIDKSEFLFIIHIRCSLKISPK